MATPQPSGQLTDDGNRLIGALPAFVRLSLAARLSPVTLGLRQILYRQGQPVERVYFPEAGVISLMFAMNDGRSAEIALVGREGAVAPHSRLATRMPCDAVVQVEGTALALSTADFMSAVTSHAPFAEAMAAYRDAMLEDIIQTAACNRLHSTRQRAARWILTLSDRAGSDEVPLTQDFLASMLGARRETVSLAAQRLHRTGLIDYRHGRLVIRDRARLERTSCECYELA